MDVMLQLVLPMAVFLGVSAAASIYLVRYARSALARGVEPADESDDAFVAKARFDARLFLRCLLFLCVAVTFVVLSFFAAALSDIAAGGIWSLSGFIAVLSAGAAYLWRKGALL